MWREWFSHSGHWLTPAWCVPLLRDWWSIWTALLHVCNINWQDWQDIKLAQVIQVLIFFQHGNNCSMLCSFLPRTGTGNMIPGSDRIPGSRNTAASPTKESSSHKGWDAWKTPAFSALVAKETIFIDLTLCEHGKCEERMVLSQWSLADTCMCAPSSGLVIDMNCLAACMQHQLARLTKHWTSTSDTSAYILPAWQNLFNAVLILARTGKGNMIPDRDRIPGSRNTAASTTKESSSHKGWGAWKSPAFSALLIAKETLFIDLNFGEDGNCEENSSLTVVTAWHLHACVWPLFGTGDQDKLDCCTNAPSNGKTGKTLNLHKWYKCLYSSSMAEFLQCSVLFILARNRNRQHDSW